MRTPVLHSVSARREARRKAPQGSRQAQDTDHVVGWHPLPATYRDHPLKGEWGSFRDAHLEPDWLLIYKINGTVLRLERTGTHHADLFRE